MADAPATIPQPPASVAPLPAPAGSAVSAAAGPSRRKQVHEYFMSKTEAAFLDPRPCAMYRNFGLLMLVFLGLMGTIGFVVGLIASNDSPFPAAARFVRDAAPFAIAAGAGLTAWNMFLGGEAKEERNVFTINVVLFVALMAAFIIYSSQEGHVFYRKPE